MNATTGHTIRLLTHTELLTYATAGWTLCARKGCDDPHVYYVTRLTAYGQPDRERLCARHGTGFARRHKLTAPEPPEAPKAPEVFTVTTRGGTYEFCPRCRHWLGRTDLVPGECLPGCGCVAACHRVPAEVTP